MRLNRVLLLAATISMMIFAMVFTISCSGDDGKAGKDGKGCTAQENKKDGTIEIYCGGSDEPSGTLSSTGSKGDTGPQGPKGEPGSLENLPAGACFVKKVGGVWHALCDEVDQGVIGGTGPGGAVGGCSFVNEDPYNPNELVMECSETGVTGIYLCGGHFFNKNTHFCTNGKTRQSDVNAYRVLQTGEVGFGVITTPDWTGRYYNIAGLSGYDWYTAGDEVNGMIKSLFNTSPVDPDRLVAADTLFRCGEGSTLTRLYDPNKKFCYNNKATGFAKGTLLDLCAGASYDNELAYDKSSPKGKKHLYGNAIVIGTTCSVDKKLVANCINGTNKQTPGTTVNVIDGTILKNGQLLYDTTAANKNLPISFDPETEFCRVLASPSGNNRVEKVPLCGGKGGYTYGVDQQCDNGKVKDDCGGVLYDGITQFCWTAGKVGDKCSYDPSNYDPDRAFCSFGIANTASKSITPGTSSKDPWVTREIPTELCAGKTYNLGDWKWQYCTESITGSGASAVTTQYLVPCGINQQPQLKSTSTCECIPGANEVNNSGNKQCLCLEYTSALVASASSRKTGDGDGDYLGYQLYNAQSNVCARSATGAIVPNNANLIKCANATDVLQVVSVAANKQEGTAVCCPQARPFYDETLNACTDPSPSSSSGVAVGLVCPDADHLSIPNTDITQAQCINLSTHATVPGCNMFWGANNRCYFERGNASSTTDGSCLSVLGNRSGGCSFNSSTIRPTATTPGAANEFTETQCTTVAASGGILAIAGHYGNTDHKCYFNTKLDACVTANPADGCEAFTCPATGAGGVLAGRAQCIVCNGGNAYIGDGDGLCYFSETQCNAAAANTTCTQTL